MHLPTDLINNELKIFETHFKEAVRSQAPLLDRIMRIIVKRKGKQLRPMFVLLSAKLCGEVNQFGLPGSLPRRIATHRYPGA